MSVAPHLREGYPKAPSLLPHLLLQSLDPQSQGHIPFVQLTVGHCGQGHTVAQIIVHGSSGVGHEGIGVVLALEVGVEIHEGGVDPDVEGFGNGLAGRVVIATFLIAPEMLREVLTHIDLLCSNVRGAGADHLEAQRAGIAEPCSICLLAVHDQDRIAGSGGGIIPQRLVDHDRAVLLEVG